MAQTHSAALAMPFAKQFLCMPSLFSGSEWRDMLHVAGWLSRQQSLCAIAARRSPSHRGRMHARATITSNSVPNTTLPSGMLSSHWTPPSASQPCKALSSRRLPHVCRASGLGR